MKEFDKLVDIIKTLRGDNGCQWDKEQTLDSIKPHLLEETYEVLESILEKDFDDLKEELGDLLCQIIFLAQLSEEDKHFNIKEVLNEINNKLISRHPHVFGNIKTNNVDLILKNWEAIKQTEGKKKLRKSILDGIPKTLPSLTKAYKMQDKASRVGFDWNNISDIVDKVEEEIIELKKALKENIVNNIEEEIGDSLFSIVNLARSLSIDPEHSLQKSINKFYNRFQFIENEIKKQNLSFDKLSIGNMNSLWNKAKQTIKTP